MDETPQNDRNPLSFSDAAIIDHDTALIESGDGSRTNGLSLTILHAGSAVEVLLTRQELRLALRELDEDWDATVGMGLDHR